MWMMAGVMHGTDFVWIGVWNVLSPYDVDDWISCTYGSDRRLVSRSN
jgi:hypothetical protein